MTKPTAIDLFAGAGGLTVGLRQAGFRVAAAVEFDPVSAASYKANHHRTRLLVSDVRDITGPQLLEHAGFKKNTELDLLTGCPPCQGFSTLQTRRNDTSDSDFRNNLVFEILRLVRSIRPRALIVENVPGLQKNWRFKQFRAGLTRAGYVHDYAVVDAANFGVPQRRKRLVLLALRDRSIPTNWSRHSSRLTTVRDSIESLSPAGQSGDPLHDHSEQRSASVTARILATPRDGGSRVDVSAKLGLACHTRSQGYFDVYGRMAWDSVAPTITSGCHNPSKGRFLHPEENRAITLREAAILQSFPISYKFSLSRGKEHVARQIGNAFPPGLIRPIARQLRKVLR